MKTGIVNYGLGNIGSLKNMLTHIGGNATVVDLPTKSGYVIKSFCLE